MPRAGPAVGYSWIAIRFKSTNQMFLEKNIYLLVQNVRVLVRNIFLASGVSAYTSLVLLLMEATVSI